MRRFLQTLTKEENFAFNKLSTPKKIQDFLESLPVNFERGGDTLMSPRRLLRQKKAHCFEGALFAAAVFLYHGEPPLILDLKTAPPDDHHVVALFRRRRLWGAVSKTNHAVLRYRDPVYRSPRELAMSYFHEYFLDNGKKTLRSYALFNLNRVKRNWITDEKDLWYVDRTLDRAKHAPILPGKGARILRRAEPIERRAGKLVVWKKRL
ncbi:hypothetical protein EPN83_01870 [Patescibacteria group bacterium]|nr:MAG: hypothetical protein EPN83_01870 [Patescibacteria group bacterium]